MAGLLLLLFFPFCYADWPCPDKPLGENDYPYTWPSNGSISYQPGINCTLMFSVPPNKQLELKFERSLSQEDSFTVFDDYGVVYSNSSDKINWVRSATNLSVLFVTKQTGNFSISRSYSNLTYDVDTSGLATAFSQSQTVEKAVVVVANEPIAIFAAFDGNDTQIRNTQECYIFEGNGTEKYLTSLYALIISNTPYIYNSSAAVVTFFTANLQTDNLGGFLIRSLSDIQNFEYSFMFYKLADSPRTVVLNATSKPAAITILDTTGYYDFLYAVTFSDGANKLDWLPASYLPPQKPILSWDSNNNLQRIPQNIAGFTKTFVAYNGTVIMYLFTAENYRGYQNLSVGDHGYFTSGNYRIPSDGTHISQYSYMYAWLSNVPNQQIKFTVLECDSKGYFNIYVQRNYNDSYHNLTTNSLLDVGDKFDILYPGMNGNNDTGGMIKWEIVEETYWANTTTMGTTPSGKSTGETTGMTSWENTTQGTTGVTSWEYTTQGTTGKTDWKNTTQETTEITSWETTTQGTTEMTNWKNITQGTTRVTSWENTTQGTTSILTTNKNLSPSTVGSTAPTYTPNQETTLKTTTPTVIPDTTTHGSSRSIITFASFMVILFTNFVHIIL